MVDYPYAGILVADAVSFRRATSAAITVYDVNDTASTTPLVLKDLSGLPLPNPLTSSADGFVQPFIAQSEGIKLVGGGLTVVEYSHKGMRDAASAAATAAQTAANNASTAAAEVVTTASVNGAGKLILTKASGATQDAGSVIGPAGPAGPKGADGSNVLPTDTAIKNAITTPGTETATALSATYATKQELADLPTGALASNRIALIGDSITNQNSASVNASTIFYNAAGYFTWANILLNQAFTVVTPGGTAVGEFGGSGKTAAQILSDDAPAWAASNADWGLVLAGTNDIPTRTAAAIAADLLSIWRLGTAAGKKVIACTVTPRNITADTDAMRSTLRDLNRLIRANALAEPNVILADLYATVVDPATGKMSTAFGAVGDGAGQALHPNGQAAIRMGKVIADTLRPIIPAVPGPLPMDAVDAKSLLPNPFMTGDTSGLATNTNAYVLGAGVHTKSKVPRTDGIAGEWQQIAITSAPSPNADGAQIQQQTLAVGTEWNVGDTVYGVVEFETDAAGWAVRHIRQDITFFGGAEEASGLKSDSGERTAATVSLIAPGRGVIRTPNAVIPANTTRLQMNVHVYGVGTIRFGRFDILKA